MEKIKVAGVSYLNTKPFLYGINKLMADQIELTVQHPSKLAEQLMNQEVDVALVPVSVIPLIKQSKNISNYCIGCDGEVSSVVICSDVPIERADQIYLDYQSRTSVQLSKVLLKNHWHLNPKLINASPGFENEVKGKTAGLFIGDRALELKKKYEFVYDLGFEWKKLTSLPFVFACWVAVTKLSSQFESDLNAAFAFGIKNMQTVIEEEQLQFPAVDVRDYLTQKIQFNFDDEKKKALKLFYELSAQ
ncbi:MAG: menaquinone biosynthesis protein [Chitinophagales bacterium]|nr:menaquinone biosynthesis protein [Chitinophagales bacterium]